MRAENSSPQRRHSYGGIVFTVPLYLKAKTPRLFERIRYSSRFLSPVAERVPCVFCSVLESYSLEPFISNPLKLDVLGIS